MLCTTWGGTLAEAWTSRGALESDPEFRALFFADDARKLQAYFQELTDFEKKYRDWKAASGQAEVAGRLQRARNHAADHAAESIVIYDLQKPENYELSRG